MPAPAVSGYVKMERKFKWAYAMYRNELNVGHEHNRERYDRIRRMAQDVNMPTHIKTEFIAMAEELKKEWECPICCEFIPKGELDITTCGHKYCKACLAMLKVQHEPQCALCRRELRS